MASGIDANLPQLPYIVTDLLVAMNHNHGPDAVNYHTLQLYSVVAYASAKDTAFKTEWDAIQAERKAEAAKGYKQGAEGFEEVDLAFRMRERTALINAAQRNGIISKVPNPTTKWNPLEAKP